MSTALAELFIDKNFTIPPAKPTYLPDPENTEENQQETTDTSQEITENTQSVYDQATDWTINNDLGLEYSASLDVYRDPNTGLLYRWNAETASYDQIVE